jgi:signal transduction histidine kinase
VTSDRLTRQELSWLLAQEARGAAKALREGVSLMKQPELRDPAAPVETTLDALDDAIGKLSELQSGARGAPRRGRIDLAALLYQVAPGARIAMQPGDGTEVFGEEAELCRMLHVLVNQTNSTPAETAPSASPEVRIRREDNWVKISVELGPDASATAELERRWLSRMATRHGGRLELEGGTQTIVLPAEGSGEEMLELRKELEQAQQLGEAYARELAQVFASRDAPAGSAESEPSSLSGQRFEILQSLASALLRPMRAWLEQMRVDATHAVEVLGERAELTQSLTRRVTGSHDVFTELRRVAECSLDEPARTLDVAALARQATAAAEAHASRHGVRLVLDAPDRLELVSQRNVLSLLLQALLDHAISATPRDGRVTLRLRTEQSGAEILTEDGGPSIPETARADLLRFRIDPSSLGRPADLALLIAEAAAGYLGSALTLAESAERLTVTRAVLNDRAAGAD